MEHMVLDVPKMSNNTNEVRVLVICLGNICRSPALEITLKKALSDSHVKHVYVESRGLSEKQRGKSVDERVAKELELRGYTVPKTKVSIPVSERDFYEFEYLLAADQKVLEMLRSMKPIDAHPVIELASHWSVSDEREIPDPYKQSDALVVKSVVLAEQYAKDITNFLNSKS